MGVEIKVEHLTKRFGRQTIWEDVSLTLPAGEISVLLGPSGTGKSVFLKTLIGLLKPENGSIIINGRDLTKVKEKELYEIRKLFGVLFQDGALFGSQNLFDNIAFPLREHTKKSEREIKDIVLEKMELTGLTGSEKKLPGEISGGMRKRAGLARALVLDPEILLFDEPDSGLDPVRTAYLNQLIVDLNAQIEATFLIVTHDINTARTVPDNIGLLYRRHLAMFGPREMLLSSNEPVVRQFLNAQREGPIGMAEEKDAGELAAEAGTELQALPPIPVQLFTSAGDMRRTQRPPGAWLREHGVTPPPGSFPGLDVDTPEAGAVGTPAIEDLGEDAAADDIAVLSTDPNEPDPAVSDTLISEQVAGRTTSPRAGRTATAKTTGAAKPTRTAKGTKATGTAGTTRTTKSAKATTSAPTSTTAAPEPAVPLVPPVSYETPTPEAAPAATATTTTTAARTRPGARALAAKAAARRARPAKAED